MLQKKGIQETKQIVDHNYVNNIYCTILSTLQSLKLVSQNKYQQLYRHKLFNSYDKIDYSMKNRLELQSQLQTHLIIFKASLQSYGEQYKNMWIPPLNFDIQRVTSFISTAKKIFNENSDEISSRLSKDFLNILKGQSQNLYIDVVSIKGSYNQVEKFMHSKDLMKNSLRSWQIMGKERDFIEEQQIQSTNDLKVNLNLNYNQPIYYRYILVSTKYYEKYLKDNTNFQACLLDSQEIDNTIQQAFNRQQRNLSYYSQRDIVIQLQICNNIVLRNKIIQ